MPSWEARQRDRSIIMETVGGEGPYFIELAESRSIAIRYFRQVIMIASCIARAPDQIHWESCSTPERHPSMTTTRDVSVSTSLSKGDKSSGGAAEVMTLSTSGILEPPLFSFVSFLKRRRIILSLHRRHEINDTVFVTRSILNDDSRNSRRRTYRLLLEQGNSSIFSPTESANLSLHCCRVVNAT